MGDVFLDGEKVDFQGNAPETAVAAWQVIEDYLGGAGRVLETATVNGVACDVQQAMEIESYDRIEFCSLSISRKLLNLGIEWQCGCKGVVDTMESVAASILSVSWEDCQTRVVELIENLRPFVEGFGVIEEQGRHREADWAKAFTGAYEACMISMEATIQAVESRDCIRLSDQIALDFSSNWSALLECVDAEVLPLLKKEVAGE